ncbi:hypothetical protein CVT26_003811, partial [Gymnopilus dilepis]
TSITHLTGRTFSNLAFSVIYSNSTAQILPDIRSMMENVQRSASISAFERMLLISATSLPLVVLDFIALRELYILSKLNKRLNFIVRYYTDHKWKVIDLLNRFFADTQGLLDFMEDENAILFGSAVFRFLDRTFGQKCTLLDVCIHAESSERMNHIMELEGFKFKSSARSAKKFLTAVKNEIYSTPPHKLKSSGERNSSESDRSPWGPYDFRGVGQKHKLRIRIHVVRCDPYRHIMTLKSSALMNYISWNCVVSLFPNSAFIRRRSFVSRQEDLSWRRSPKGFHAWFDNYAKKNDFSVIGITHRQYKEVETGERHVGDKFCWIIPVIQTVPSTSKQPVKGPSFEVLDYISGTTRVDSYMRIGEPDLWRYDFRSIFPPPTGIKNSKVKQNTKKLNYNMSLDTYNAVAVVDQGTAFVADNGMLDGSVILNGNPLPDANVTLNGSAILDGNATPKICGSTRCTVPRDAQILKRCAGCQVKYYCCRACQIIDWPIHRVLCDRKAAERPTEGWEDAIAQFHDTYGVFVLSYGIGLVFAISDLNPAYIPTPMEWRNLWQTYACAVEIKVTEVSNAVASLVFGDIETAYPGLITPWASFSS